MRNVHVQKDCSKMWWESQAANFGLVPKSPGKMVFPSVKNVSSKFSRLGTYQSCRTRRQNYSTSTSTSFRSSRKPSNKIEYKIQLFSKTSSRSSMSFKSSRIPSTRSSTRLMVRGSSHLSVDILMFVPWIENGTRTRMSTDGWLEPRSIDRVTR